MKKVLFKSLAISFITNLTLLLINLMCAFTIHSLPFSISFAGGECIEHIGFGINLLEIFSFSNVDEIVSNNYSISFDFISIIVPFVVLFIVLFIIFYIIYKIKTKKN